jgi:hypothetical protein
MAKLVFTKSYQTLGVELMQCDKRKEMTKVEGIKLTPSLLPRPPTNGNLRPSYTINDPTLLVLGGYWCTLQSNSCASPDARLGLLTLIKR